MKSLTLMATEIEAVARDDENMAYFWAAEKHPGQHRYLSIARDLSEEDFQVERDDQGWSCRGGIASLLLNPCRLVVTLGPVAARELGGVDEINVEIPESRGPTFAQLKSVLRTICGDVILHIENEPT